MHMKKKIIGLALFALCVFLFATLRNLSCPAKAENNNDKSSRFQATLALDLVRSNMSMIEPLMYSPGSGGGRGPYAVTPLFLIRFDFDLSTKYG